MTACQLLLPVDYQQPTQGYRDIWLKDLHRYRQLPVRLHVLLWWWYWTRGLSVMHTLCQGCCFYLALLWMWHIQWKHHADTVWSAAFLCFYYELITVVAKDTRCISSCNSLCHVGCSTLSRTWHQYMLADVNRMQKYACLLSVLLQCASSSSVSLLLSPHSGEVMFRKSPLSSHPWKYLHTIPITKRLGNPELPSCVIYRITTFADFLLLS